MTRRARKVHEGQDRLPLPCDPAGQDALRAAYAGSGLGRRGISFERAMATPALALSLLNAARVIVRGGSVSPISPLSSRN
jgi:hypothetical protein